VRCDARQVKTRLCAKDYEHETTDTCAERPEERPIETDNIR